MANMHMPKARRIYFQHVKIYSKIYLERSNEIGKSSVAVREKGYHKYFAPFHLTFDTEPLSLLVPLSP
jgi:hypothetical protein